jgi:hypothetical protein
MSKGSRQAGWLLGATLAVLGSAVWVGCADELEESQTGRETTDAGALDGGPRDGPPTGLDGSTPGCDPVTQIITEYPGCQ